MLHPSSPNSSRSGEFLYSACLCVCVCGKNRFIPLDDFLDGQVVVSSPNDSDILLSV